MSASSNKPLLNYGERLYQKGIKRKEEKDRSLRRQQYENEKSQRDQFSFAPQINPVSRMLVRPTHEKPEDALIKFARAKEDRMEQLRHEQFQNEQQECSFRPEISKKSEVMMNKEAELNSIYRNKFSNLYEDARRRKDRQDQIYSACIEAECTF
jgi:hypothetical protein